MKDEFREKIKQAVALKNKIQNEDKNEKAFYKEEDLNTFQKEFNRLLTEACETAKVYADYFSENGFSGISDEALNILRDDLTIWENWGYKDRDFRPADIVKMINEELTRRNSRLIN